MRKIFGYLGGILFIFCLSAHAELTKLVVNTANANVRLKPNLQAIVISSVPLGGILISEGKIDNWFKVSLPADETGLILKGYIHQSLVEALGQIDALVLAESSAAMTKYRIQVVSANASVRLKPDLGSPSIFSIPVGATIQSEEKRGEWYKIDLPPDGDGVVISGFVISKDVELLEEIRPRVELQGNAGLKGQTPPIKPKNSTPAMKNKETARASRKSLITAKGIKIGLNLANVTGDDVEIYWENKMGLSAGGFLTFGLSDIIAIQPEVLFTMKGYKSEQEWNYYTSSVTYLEFSVLAKALIPTGGGITPNIFAGPSLGIKINGDEYRGTDTGLVFGGGIDFTIGAKKFLAECRYTMSLSSVSIFEHGLMTERKRDDVKNRVFSIILGYSF